MSETKSTNVSMDVYSSKFSTCKAIFPHKIVRPLRNFRVDHQFQFANFLEDIVTNNLKIDQYIADNLKRANAKNVLNHASNFPCEYCFCKGVRFYPKISKEKATEKQFEKLRETLKNMNDGDDDIDMSQIQDELSRTEKSMKNRYSYIVWPACTMHKEPRTKEKVEEIANRLENGEELTPEECKGILGRSPLMNIDGFDIVMDCPTEYLHSGCLGVTKRLICLTFSVGENRQRVTKRKLSAPSDFNALILIIKVPHEFNRRVRELDFAVLKGQEYRNIVLFFFPIVIACIPDKDPERKVWLLYAYMMRSCTVPEKEFKNIDLQTIEDACEQFYKLYEKIFGPSNCSYNTHIICCHLLEMRHHGPLTFTSAFAFESFYGEIRNSFVPGTPATLKQIFKKILLKRAITPHKCENSIYYSDHETNMENNTLIYCYKDLTHKFYKICKVGKYHVICQPQGRRKKTFTELSSFDFSKVGVYEKGLKSNEKIKIMKKDIHGKALEVYGLLITCGNNILREK